MIMNLKENKKTAETLLFPYQQAAVDFACDKLHVNEAEPGGGVAMFMEMGLGKTMVAIRIAEMLYSKGDAQRVLIVAPISVFYEWEAQLEVFSRSDYELHVLKGTRAEKKKALSDIPKTGLQYIIVNYESVTDLKEELLSLHAECIVCDEGNYIKNPETKMSQTMQELGRNTRFRILLNGTPITNGYSDIYGQYSFVDSGVFDMSFSQFKNKYVHKKKAKPRFGRITLEQYVSGSAAAREKKALSELKECISSVAFIRRLSDCIDLPKKEDRNVYVNLEPEVRQAYINMADQAFLCLRDQSATYTHALARLSALMQITGGFLPAKEGIKEPVSYAKIRALREELLYAATVGEKTVVVAVYRQEIREIENLLKTMDIHYAVLHGDIVNRDEQIRRFNEEQDCTVFLGQIATAGYGINLCSANRMIFYSQDYNLGHYYQTRARIYRVGQTRDCIYIHLLARNTIDAKVMWALERKAKLADHIISECQQGENPFYNTYEDVAFDTCVNRNSKS